MFALLGRLSYRYRWAVVGAWALLFLAALPILPRLEEPLKVGGFSSPEIESARARAVLETDLDLSPSQTVVIFSSATLTASDPRFQRQIDLALADVPDLPNVTDILTPADDPGLISPDGGVAYAIVGLDLPPEDAQRLVPSFAAALHQPPDLTMLVAGAPAFYADIETVSQRDLRRAELIAFPFALIALLVVFGSLVAAVVPLAVGGLGVAGALLTLYGLAHVTDLSIFVLNLATMLGLGLAVDYSLFVTSRYREELTRQDGDVRNAVERAAETAGRAVFFSGLTVLIGLLGLSFFSFMFLRSVGIAGVVVVFFSILAALTLLPAVLGIIGTRIDRYRLPGRRPTTMAHDATKGFWSALSRRVMSRPVLVLIPTLGVLLLLGSPFLNVNVSSPDARILPTDLPSRQGFDVLAEAFGPGEISPFVLAVQSPTSIYAEANVGALYDLTARLSADERVTRVQSIVSYADEVSREQAIALLGIRRGLGNFGVDTRIDRLSSERTALVLAYTRYPANDGRNKDLLGDIRSTELGGDLSMLVNGGTAEIVDVVDRM